MTSKIPFVLCLALGTLLGAATAGDWRLLVCVVAVEVGAVIVLWKSGH